MCTKQVLAFCTVFLSGCGFAGWMYTGDGELRDSGPLASHNRYVVRLGSLDLSKTEEKIYHLANLPEANFTVGFDIVARDHNVLPLWESKPLISLVRLEMTNERDEIVFSTLGPLSVWTWAGRSGEPQWSFVYRVGASREVSISPGVWTYEPLGVLADEGWGTYFTPRSKGKYKLRVSVVEPDVLGSRYQVLVQAQGGGWK